MDSKNLGKPLKPGSIKIDAAILELVLNRARLLSFHSSGRFLIKGFRRGAPPWPTREVVSGRPRAPERKTEILIFNGRKKWEGADAKIVGTLMVGKEDPNGLIEVLAIPHDPKMKAMEICRILREELGLISLSEFNGRVREQKMLVFMEVKRAKRILDECEPKVEDIDTSAPDFARKNRRFCVGPIIEDLLLPVCGLCGRAIREGEQFVSVGVGAIHMNMKEGADPDYLPSEQYHLDCVQDARSGNPRRTTPVFRALQEPIGLEIQQENCVKLIKELTEESGFPDD